jgi:hypothetical protein
MMNTQARTTLTDKRDELVSKMEAKWRWLDLNSDHPKHREREDEFLSNLKQYEAIEHRLSSAA